MSELLEQRIEAAARDMWERMVIFETETLNLNHLGAWFVPDDADTSDDATIRRHMLGNARAALLASDAVLAQAGMVVVPREATPIMKAAANRLNHPRDEEIYRAMISAAAPDNGGGESDG